MKVRKRFGQHFLTDEGVLQNIVSAIGLRASDSVLEIGPGPGALTDLLVSLPEIYKAVEIDRDFIPLLQARHPQIQLTNADILKVDLGALLPAGSAWRLLGNLPYNISSPLISVLTDFVTRCPGRVADMHFMLQREMAQRLSAEPGTKAWGRLSVMVQLHFDVEFVLDVSPSSFSPPPKVWSSVVRMLPKTTGTLNVDLKILDRVLRLAFSGRRKRLSNSLKILELDWSEANVDPGLRADNVTVEQYLELARLTPTSLLSDEVKK